MQIAKMVHKKQKKGGRDMNRRTGYGTTLREENIGKKRVDASSMLSMEHLHKLATWAGVEAGITPLGALLGHRLASSAEAEGILLDPSIFVCHKCESILQPGFNCNARIKKNVKKGKRCKKSHIPSQNNVVYECHFCSHHNILRGTQRGHVKSLLPSRPRPETVSKAQCSSIKVTNNSERGLEGKANLDLKNVGGEVPLAAGPLRRDAVTPEVSLEKSPLTPLERVMNLSKRKPKRNRHAPNKAGPDSGSSSTTLNSVETACGGSSKRKRKGWSSLKEIAKNNEAQSSWSLNSFAIPFLLQAAK